MSEVGDILRTAREKKSVTLDEVAEATRIKRIYLEALEQGEYKVLPGAAYVTGFLRNYATYLGLHPDDVVQEFYARYAMPQPAVKAATRVLANGYHRKHRSRLLWGVAVLVLILAGAYAVKQYNDTYQHSYAAPLVTPANLGGADTTPVNHPAPKLVHLRLHALAPVWVRVTADGTRVFEGVLRPRTLNARWVAHHQIFVFTYEPAHLSVFYNGRFVGRMAGFPGLTVDEATTSGWHQVS